MFPAYTTQLIVKYAMCVAYACRDAVSEGLEGRTADILEAAGIETDEMVGTSIAEAQTALGKAGLAAKRMGSSGASAMAAAKRGRL